MHNSSLGFSIRNYLLHEYEGVTTGKDLSGARVSDSVHDMGLNEDTLKISFQTLTLNGALYVAFEQFHCFL